MKPSLISIACRRRARLRLPRPPSPPRRASISFRPAPIPHDVAPAPDGTVWYSGQQRGFLGRFDPKTGKNEEIPLGPRRGAAWRHRRAGRRALGHRGRPERDRPRRSGDACRSSCSRCRGNSPTPISTPPTFDKKGMLWFTGQSGVHGRRRSRDRQGRRLALAAPGQLRHHHARPAATSGSPRSPAISSARSTPRPAPSPWSIRRARAPARAASGRTPRASCG